MLYYNMQQIAFMLWDIMKEVGGYSLWLSENRDLLPTD